MGRGGASSNSGALPAKARVQKVGTVAALDVKKALCSIQVPTTMMLRRQDWTYPCRLDRISENWSEMQVLEGTVLRILALWSCS